MRKAMIALTLLASSAMAETVYFSAAGKTYHKAASCAILARSAKVYQGEKADAEKHELHACRSCYSAKKSNNGTWGKAVEKQ